LVWKLLVIKWVGLYAIIIIAIVYKSTGRRHNMRKCFVALCAVVMVVAVSGKVPASPMDSLNWWTYDSFPGPGLNTTLWQLPPEGNYVGYTVNNGLTIITSSDQPKFSLNPTYSINTGDFFAEKFSFNVLAASVQPGGVVNVTTDIGAPSVPNSAIPISWAWVNNYQGFSGKLFASGPDNNPIFAFTDVTQGQLGFIYDGTSVSMYYNEGSGWQMLYSVNPGWSGPLQFGKLGVEIQGALGSSMLTTFTNVQFATSAVPVPEPTTMLLLGSGLIGLAGYGRRKFFKK
jgi:hypothetical protein